MDIENLTPEQLEQVATLAFGSNKPLHFGPIILGAVIDSLLCGVIFMQCGTYVSSTNKDRPIIKALVAYVVTMNIWSTAFAWAWIWELFVDNFGLYRALFSIKYIPWFSFINACTVVAVQAFFGWRAWKLMDCNQVLGIIILMLILLACGAGVAIKVRYTWYDSTIYAFKMRVPTYICLSCTVIVDIMITGIILNYFVHQRTINKRTNHLLSRLTRVTFESQLPPTLMAIGLFVAYSAKNDSLVSVPFIWGQPKMYGISLLHTLNVRRSLQVSEQGVEMTAEGCTATSGAVPRFHNVRLVHDSLSLSTTMGTSSFRSPSTCSFPPTIVEQREFDVGKDNKDNTAGLHGNPPDEQYKGWSKAILT